MIATVLVLALALSSQDDVGAKSEQARRLYQAGGKAFDAGKYTVAINAFEAAHSIAPRALISFAMAQAYRLQFFIDADPSKLKRAVELYRLYLEQDSEGPRRDHAVEHISVLQPMLERLEADAKLAGRAVSSAPAPRAEKTQLMISAEADRALGALDGGEPQALPAVFDVAPGKHSVRVEASGYFPQTLEAMAVDGKLVAVHVDLEKRPGLVTVKLTDGDVVVDGRAYGSLPLPRPIELPEGEHLISIRRKGAYPLVQELQVAKGQELIIDTELETTTQRKVLYGFAVGTAALATGGFVVAGMGFERISKAIVFEERVRRGESLTEAEADQHQAHVDRRNELRIIAGSLFVTAAVTAVVGFVLYLTD